MPSFFMRFRRVDAGNPRTSAAPPLPAISPLVICKTSEMCSLSASASVHTLPTSDCRLKFSGRAASCEIELSGTGRRTASPAFWTDATARTGNAEPCPRFLRCRLTSEISVGRGISRGRPRHSDHRSRLLLVGESEASANPPLVPE